MGLKDFHYAVIYACLHAPGWEKSWGRDTHAEKGYSSANFEKVPTHNPICKKVLKHFLANSSSYYR